MFESLLGFRKTMYMSLVVLTVLMIKVASPLAVIVPDIVRSENMSDLPRGLGREIPVNSVARVPKLIGSEGVAVISSV